MSGLPRNTVFKEVSRYVSSFEDCHAKDWPLYFVFHQHHNYYFASIIIHILNLFITLG